MGRKHRNARKNRGARACASKNEATLEEARVRWDEIKDIAQRLRDGIQENDDGEHNVVPGKPNEARFEYCTC